MDNLKNMKLHKNTHTKLKMQATAAGMTMHAYLEKMLADNNGTAPVVAPVTPPEVQGEEESTSSPTWQEVVQEYLDIDHAIPMGEFEQFIRHLEEEHSLEVSVDPIRQGKAHVTIIDTDDAEHEYTFSVR